MNPALLDSDCSPTPQRDSLAAITGSASYDIGKEDAIYLLALLKGYDKLPQRSNADLLNLLRNTLLLANSIAENCKEWLEMAAIIHGDMHPYQAEKLNIPTLNGALSAAVAIPRVDPCDKMCVTCAFRVGSPANQTEATASDIFDCLEDGTLFMCHDFEGAKPTRACRGFVAAFREQNADVDAAADTATPQAR